ncbi:cupin domain-containing protein [Streptomyces sp. NPDC007025]|uniref:cupin domain-containing protein n=1 Tax=Streptomyces sp. NPDC007025 TaxID=3364771 RepID=UPI003678FE44
MASPATGAPFTSISEPEDDSRAHEARPSREIAPGVRVIEFADTKKVVKLWGQERWLHEEEPDGPYGFKFIRIKAGHRTSLQYHEHKRESYFILEGEAVMHYRATRDGENLRLPMPAGTLAHVDPGAVHRVEGVTDIVLVEVSTYDDGSDNVRLEDDYGRGDGRLAAEHDAHGGHDAQGGR